ncbi:MAG: arginine deiminase family protein [Gammaproteobacteria bacterium]
MITAQSDIGFLRRVIVKHVRDAFHDQSTIQTQWSSLNYTAEPELDEAIREYETFAKILENNNCELVYQPTDDLTSLDSLYVRDSSIVTDAGVVLCNMGKPARQPEPEVMEAFYRQIGSKVLGRIEPPGKVEGGDVTWLTPKILAVGEGYRTNREGIEQLTALLRKTVDEIVTVALPHFRGPSDVLHLMSLLSPVDEGLAVVYSPLLPVTFRNLLLELEFQLLDVPQKEFDSMGSNVLSLGPGKCLVVEGSPITRRLLEKAGVEVICYKGDEISAKGRGGPTCLTRPLLRELTS